MIKYGIIGAGWRSEFYLRIAELLPSKFSVSGIYIRNNEKQKEFADKYNVKICSSLEELLKTDFDFIVSCVNKDNISEMIKTLAAKDIPILTETPVNRRHTDRQSAGSGAIPFYAEKSSVQKNNRKRNFR